MIELGELGESPIIVTDLNIPFSVIDRISTHVINKAIELKNTIRQQYLTGIYRTVYPMTAEYTFLSAANATFTKIDQILGHKTNCNRFKIIKIIKSMLTDLNGIKQEINNIKITGKSPIDQKLNHMLLNNPCDKEEVRGNEKII